MAKLKNFFIKIGRWFKNHAPTKRRLIQIYTALLFNANIKGYFGKGSNIIYQGDTKKLCAPGLNCYSCPGAVAACPLGALQNALGASDQRAPYYVLGILGLLGLMFARTICGFLCPIGLGQELLYKVKTPKLKKSRYTRILSYFKYILLIVFVIAIPLIYSTVPAFCKYVCPAGTSAAVLQLSNGNNYELYKMLNFIFSWKFTLLVLFIVLSVFIFRFFCRFICPLGAIYGFFNRIALIGVKLDRQKCIDCGLCIQTCKMDIRHVGDHECINCGECIPVCPTQAISWKGSKIFVHASEVQPAVSSAEEQAEVKPISSMLVSGTAAEAVGTVATVEEKPIEKEEKEQAVAKAEKSFKKRAFWLQFSAWALALAVLVTALVYYNFLAPTAEVYDDLKDCPNFTYTTVYDTKGAYKDGEKIQSFSVQDNRGRVTVLNFWYTSCGPCVAELPAFNRVKEEYGDKVTVVAVHTADTTNEVIQRFIDTANNVKTSWSDYSIIFTREISFDNSNSYEVLGGKGAYPMTVIVDANGKIAFTKHGSMSEELLKSELEKALAEDNK